MSRRRVDRNALFLLGVVAPLTLFLWLAGRVTSDRTLGSEGELIRLSTYLYELGPPYTTVKVLLYLSILAGAALAVTVLALLVWGRKRREAAFWVLAIGGALTLAQIVKPLVGRPGIGQARDEYSFPSGNAMASVALAFAVAVLLWQTRWRVPALALGLTGVVLEGVGLVAAGWHYASDVVAGWCLALAWVAALTFALWTKRSPARADRQIGVP